MDAVSALQPASAIQSIPFLFIYFRTLLRNGALLSLFFSCTSALLSVQRRGCLSSSQIEDNMNHQTANSSLTSNSSASSNLSPLVPPDKRPQPKEASAVDGTLPKSHNPEVQIPGHGKRAETSRRQKPRQKVKTAAGTTPPPGAAAVCRFGSRLRPLLPPCGTPVPTLRRRPLPAFGGLLSKLQSACGIHDFLSQLTVLLVQNRISTRRAAILAYLGQILLRTLPAIQAELEPAEPQIIFDLPRPKRDDDISPERAMVNRAERCTRAATPVEPDGYDGYTSIPGNSK